MQCGVHTFSSFFLLFLSFLRRFLLSSDSASVSLSELSELSPPLPFLETPQASTRTHTRGQTSMTTNSENYAKRREANEKIQAKAPQAGCTKAGKRDPLQYRRSHVLGARSALNAYTNTRQEHAAGHSLVDIWNANSVDGNVVWDEGILKRVDDQPRTLRPLLSGAPIEGKATTQTKKYFCVFWACFFPSSSSAFGLRHRFPIYFRLLFCTICTKWGGKGGGGQKVHMP